MSKELITPPEEFIEPTRPKEHIYSQELAEEGVARNIAKLKKKIRDNRVDFDNTSDNNKKDEIRSENQQLMREIDDLMKKWTN